MTTAMEHDEDLALRRRFLDRAKRVVIKVGSAVLTTGEGLNLPVLDALAKEICALRHSGRQVILVSSGAVAAGRRKMGPGGPALTPPGKKTPLPSESTLTCGRGWGWG